MRKSCNSEPYPDRRRQAIDNLVHDVMTPIGAALGFAEVLCDSPSKLTEQQRRDFTMEIRENLERAVGLIRQLPSLCDL